MKKIPIFQAIILSSILPLIQGCGGFGIQGGGEGDGGNNQDVEDGAHQDGLNRDGVFIDSPDSHADNMPGDGVEICADVTLDTRMVTPTVILLVDQSGSMDEQFSSSGTRWNVMRDSLLAVPGGLIYDLQSIVRFGLDLYSAISDDSGHPVGECPLITKVPPDLNNHDAIQAVYATEDPIDDTPTGDSIDVVVADLIAAPNPTGDPSIIILATDGEPDRCEELDPQNGQAEAVAAAQNAYANGYRLYIISVGAGSVSAAHLQDMANAGVGADPSDPAPYWVAGDDAGLRDALRAIVGGEISCTIELNGRIVVDEACTGTVVLNGHVLPCNDPNGWRAVDENHIELQGEACETLTGGDFATLTATFPCGAILI
jgi:hypothetical protein